MNNLTVFRALIILGVVLSIAGACIDFIVPGLVPPVLSEAYETYTSTEPSWTFIAVAGLYMLALLILGITATVGLLVLRPRARTLAVWTTVLSFVSYPFLGAVVYSGTALLLLSLSMTIWGAALAMAFYSELNGHFERPAR